MTFPFRDVLSLSLSFSLACETTATVRELARAVRSPRSFGKFVEPRECQFDNPRKAGAKERIRRGTLIKVWIQLAACDSLIPLANDS